ncbi:SMI1/KNR4 family protein [Micromonospora sp. WMMD708]|uniref:SMI1/KNR4 family protein n=1 Tax=Micromonospora sp. WMMD708 TaxID=3403464 RepID=UPI003BF590AF
MRVHHQSVHVKFAGWVMIILEDLATALRACRTATVSGLSADEVGLLAVRWGRSSLPARYREFLSLMGREAGGLLRGTDAFFPGILDLQDRIAEFVLEDEVLTGVPSDAVAFAMHQGYQVYWMRDGSDDPPVWLWTENDFWPARHWDSFSLFLTQQAREDCGELGI